MRMTISLSIAVAALAAATPATAQNAAAPDNTTATNAAVAPTNEATNAAAPTAANDLAAVNNMPNNGVTAPATQPAKKGFPWGVIGLIGLIGLIPRTRR
ncbi:MAG: hypothetical protein ACTHJK_08955 [Sphingomicrobium sp.]